MTTIIISYYHIVRNKHILDDKLNQGEGLRVHNFDLKDFGMWPRPLSILYSMYPCWPHSSYGVNGNVII